MRLLLRSLAAPLRQHVEQLRGLERAARSGPDCLDDDALARVADGRGTPDQREHLSACPVCRAQLVELRQLLGAGAVARELERLAPPDRSARRWPARWTVAAGAAAAALVALAVVPPLVRDAGVDRLRDHPGAERGIVARAASPRGEVTGRPPFVWSSVPQASGYRLTVFDAEGGLVGSIETPDTTASLGADAVLLPGVSYWWRVEAHVDFDRWVASDLANFSVR